VLRDQSLHRSSADLVQQGSKLRLWTAHIAGDIADGAEEFAAYLENSAVRGDRERSLAIATTEREVARIETQTAARLRDLKTRYKRGEHLPKLFGSARVDCS
jgi:hypothetical protein